MLEIANNTHDKHSLCNRVPGESKFRVSLDQAGNTRYQWEDTAIEELSSMKLWDILRQARPAKNELQRRFSVAVNNELGARGELPPPDVHNLLRQLNS